MITTKVWYLPAPYTDEDFEWLDSSNLYCHVERPYKTYQNDSGWCDMSTGQEFITNAHKIYIKTETEKEEMWLKLRYIDRAVLYNMYSTPEGHYIYPGETL